MCGASRSCTCRTRRRRLTRSQLARFYKLAARRARCPTSHLAAALLSEASRRPMADTGATNGAGDNVGSLIEIKGVVVDAVFPNKLPAIYSALRIERPEGGALIAEVQQHLGDDRVRAVAMDSTDGLPRGIAVVDT